MKKIKLILSFFILTICLSYLSSCISKEAEPKLYMFNPKIDFSSINFDIKVIEPEEILIKEIYIKLYNNNQLESTLSSKDGINRVGASEDIVFNALLSETEYRIDFSFDYFVGKHSLEDEVIYSYYFKTTENNTDNYDEFVPFAELQNISVIGDFVVFDLRITDYYQVLTGVTVVLTDIKGNIISKLTMEDGIRVGSANKGCRFSNLSPNTSYIISVRADYEILEERFENIILTETEIKTDLLDIAPTASISDIIIKDDVVTFGYTIIDRFNMLTDLSVVLLDSNGKVVETLPNAMSSILESNQGTFDLLIPNTRYEIEIIANYQWNQEIKNGIILALTSFETGDYLFFPTATLTNVQTEDAVVTFDYTVTDKYHMITDLSVVLLDLNDEILSAFTILIYETLEEQGSFRLLIPNQSYKIAILGSYVYKDQFITKEKLVEASFETGDYSYFPQASITDIRLNEDSIELSYIISDPYSLLKSLQCLFCKDDDILLAIDMRNHMTDSYHTVTINKFDELEDFNKIQFEANYSYLIYEKKNEIIGSFDYIESLAEDFEYSIYSDGVYIDKYIGKSSTCIIPEMIEGKEVIVIETEAFKDSHIESVVIPNSVKRIYGSAFSGCVNLTNVTIPDSVESIYSQAFSGCSRLTNITIPNSVTSITWGVFSYCENLTNIYYEGTMDTWCELKCDVFDNPLNHHFYIRNSINEWEEVTCIEIPNTITEIGREQFYGFNNVTTITIPNSVTKIGIDAFARCSSLTSITIPDSVTKIEWAAFMGCSSLTNVVFSNNLTSIEHNAFNGCSSLTSIILPDSVTSIEQAAFYNCTSLKSITIPESITSIEWATFKECSSLTTIIIPQNLKSIRDDAFYECSSLTNVYYEGTIENWCNISFGDYESNPMYYASHFYIRNGINEWEEITSIVIPDTITEIGAYQFYGFNNITFLSIPNSVTSIGNYAFRFCTSLTSIILPKSTPSNGYGVFDNCSSPLENIYYDGTIEDWCNTQYNSFLPSINHFYIRNRNNEWEEITSLVIPDTMTEIEAYQFYGLKNITSLTLLNSIINIGDYAFKYCSSLKNIILPKSIASIGAEAFWGCNSLDNIYYEGTIEDWCNIRFSSSSSNPMDYASHFYIRNGINEWEEITSIVIPDTITEIGAYQFYGFNKVVSVTIPIYVTIIGAYAFYDCYSLVINCEAASKPDGWDSNWTNSTQYIYWGYNINRVSTDN